MRVELNHTVVFARDEVASARFLADILGLPEPSSFGPFKAVEMGPVHLDFVAHEGDIPSQHISFLVSDDAFDEIYARILAAGVAWWSDPYRTQPEQINYSDGGRAIYFDDPDGHNLEIQTRPYQFLPGGGGVAGRDDLGNDAGV